MPVSQLSCHIRIDIEGLLAQIENNEIIACAMHFLKLYSHYLENSGTCRPLKPAIAIIFFFLFLFFFLRFPRLLRCGWLARLLIVRQIQWTPQTTTHDDAGEQ